MAAIELPKTLTDYMEIRKKYETLVSFNYPPHVKQICRYTGAALAANRSCSNVLIMMAGQSGAGKSTTINKLFNNDNLCKTSSNTSATSTVWEIEASLIIKDHDLPLMKTSLMFLDVPGALDVDSSKLESNQNIVKKYLTTSPYLSPRPTKILDVYAKREKSSGSDLRWRREEGVWKSYTKVFTNLVLLSVNATDNRMVGNDSDLHRTLKMLKELDVVDMERPNLIVVATNAASLARNRELYIKKVQEITLNIRELIVKVFKEPQLTDTKVVFIENDPTGQDLEKIIDSDFYKLPDGMPSHFNLIQSMIDLFYENHDLLGMVTCGSFFGNDCIKENKTVNLREYIFPTSDLNEEQLAESFAKTIEQLKVQLVQELPLKYIARGYCPSTEKRKCRTVLKSVEKMQRIALSSETYSTHLQFKCVKIAETNCERWSQITKEHYVRKRNITYGLETGIDFDVKPSLGYFGRWETQNSKSDKSTISFIYEYRVLSLEIEDPKSHITTDLRKALQLLSKEFNKQTVNIYSNFFCEWGSHFVRKSYVGGAITLLYRRQSSNVSDQTFDSELESKVEKRLKSLETKTMSSKPETSANKDLSNIKLKFRGGTPPSATLLKLADLTPQMFAEWIRSIDKNPVELQYYIKLEPYYFLLEDPQKSSLRAATKEFFLMEAHKSLTRNNVSDAIRRVAMNTELDDISDNSDDEDDTDVVTNEVHRSTSKRILKAMWQPFRGIYKKLSSASLSKVNR